MNNGTKLLKASRHKGVNYFKKVIKLTCKNCQYCSKRYEGVEIIYTCYKKMCKVNPDDSCFKYIKQDFGFYGKQW